MPLTLPGLFIYKQLLIVFKGGINIYLATETTILAFVTCLFILANLYHPASFVTRIGQSRSMKFLSSISHAHFMTHYWVMEFINNRFPAVFKSLPVNFLCYLHCIFIITIIPIPISYLCLKFIEEPFWKIEKNVLAWIKKE